MQKPATTGQYLVCCLLLCESQAFGSMSQGMQLAGHAVTGYIKSGGADAGAVEAQAQKGRQIEPGSVALKGVAT